MYFIERTWSCKNLLSLPEEDIYDKKKEERIVIRKIVEVKIF